MTASARGLCVATLCLATWAAGLRAQEQDQAAPPESDQMARVIARLVDARTGAPVVQAFATLENLDRRALSDSTGMVVFRDIPPGEHELSIRHVAYGEQSQTLQVESMTSMVLAVELTPVAIAVAPLEVQIEHRPRFLETEGFYDRRAVGLGSFFDPQFVDRWGVGAWAEAVSFVGLLFQMAPSFRASQIGCLGGSPAIYIDGFRRGSLGDPIWIRGMSTWDIGAVELYGSTHGVPDFALTPEATCGVVVIWTRRWRNRQRQLGGGDVTLCEPKELEARVVEGVISDEFTGVLLPGAHVFATSFPAGNTRASETREIISDPDARYRICDLPLDHVLSIKAETAGSDTQEIEIELEGPLVRHDIAIRVAGPGDVVGRIVDRATGNPVPAADVFVRGTAARTQTDSQGFFRIDDVLPGDHVLEVGHIGFEQVERPVSVVADRTVEARVELSADPIELEPLVVTVLRDRRLERRGFYDRRMDGERRGAGFFMDQVAIDRRVAASTTSLIQDAPGVRVTCAGRSCNVGSTRGSCGNLTVYINGAVAMGAGRTGMSIDELVRPTEIAALEVYSDRSSTPGEYLDASGSCGAVVIWTR